MDTVFKIIAGVLIAVILCQILAKERRDLAVALVIITCCMVAYAAVAFLKPVITFLQNLQTLGQLHSEMFQILLRSVGIGMLVEITNLICADMGNAALGKALQFLAAAVILWLALPLFNELILLLQTVLEAI